MLASLISFRNLVPRHRIPNDAPYRFSREGFDDVSNHSGLQAHPRGNGIITGRKNDRGCRKSISRLCDEPIAVASRHSPVTKQNSNRRCF